VLPRAVQFVSVAEANLEAIELVAGMRGAPKDGPRAVAKDAAYKLTTTVNSKS